MTARLRPRERERERERVTSLAVLHVDPIEEQSLPRTVDSERPKLRVVAGARIGRLHQIVPTPASG